jgi:salicylate hydroxylase
MASNDPPISIALIGAGIGGLALAIGLVKQNVQCTIFESAPRFDAVGAGIGLGPNALRAMELMDEKFAKMYDEIKVGNTSPGRVHEQFEILGAEEGLGQQKGWYGGSVSHPRFTRSSAHRKALLEVMQSLIPDGTVQFNKRVLKIDQGTGKVSLEFYDGSTYTFDVVIGCDGIKGMTRKTVLGSRYPEEVASKYTNTYVYRGIAPMEEAKEIIGSYATDAKWFMKEGKGWAQYPISGGKELNIVAFIQDPDPWTGEQAVREVSREEMLSEFAGFDTRLVKLLDVSLIHCSDCSNSDNSSSM